MAGACAREPLGPPAPSAVPRRPGPQGRCQAVAVSDDLIAWHLAWHRDPLRVRVCSSPLRALAPVSAPVRQVLGALARGGILAAEPAAGGDGGLKNRIPEISSMCCAFCQLGTLYQPYYNSCCAHVRSTACSGAGSTQKTSSLPRSRSGPVVTHSTRRKR